MRTSRFGFSLVRFNSVSATPKLILAIFVVLLLIATGFAQQQTPATNQPAPQAQSPVAADTRVDTPVTIPTGTRLALVLTHPVDSKSVHRGDQLYAQITAPVIVGDRVVVPPGTFVQGKVEKLTRRGSRGEFLMQSFSLVFPDGYVATVGERTNVESGEGTAWTNPSGRAKAGAIAAPLVGTGLGALIGSAAHTTQSSTLGGTTLTSSTPKGIGIGSIVGGAAGAVVSVVLLVRSRDFYVEVGSPMEVTLTQPLLLAQNHIPDQSQQAQPLVTPIAIARPRNAGVPAASAPADHGTCYTPDIPGTPPIVIPGTPAIGDTPGTPDTVIPGTPSIPGTAYPCP